MLDFFSRREVDQLLRCTTFFVNTMIKGIVTQLAAVSGPSTRDELQKRWDYIYEPDAIRNSRRYLMRLYRVANLSGRRGKCRLAKWRRAWWP